MYTRDGTEFGSEDHGFWQWLIEEDDQTVTVLCWSSMHGVTIDKYDKNEYRIEKEQQ